MSEDFHINSDYSALSTVQINNIFTFPVLIPLLLFTINFLVIEARPHVSMFYALTENHFDFQTLFSVVVMLFVFVNKFCSVANMYIPEESRSLSYFPRELGNLFSDERCTGADVIDLVSWGVSGECKTNV